MVPLHQIIDADEARQSRGRAQSRVCRRKCSGSGGRRCYRTAPPAPLSREILSGHRLRPGALRALGTDRKKCLSREMLTAHERDGTGSNRLPLGAWQSARLSSPFPPAGRCPPWPGPLLQTACCLAARFSYAILVGSKQGLIGPAQGKWGWVGPVRPGKAEGSRQWSTEASGLRA